MLALLLALAQDGRVAVGEERWSALRLTVSGRVQLHHDYRSSEINEAEAFFAGLPGSADATDAWSGRFSLRVEAEVKDRVLGVIELENRSYDEGVNRPSASDPETDDVDIKQGYIEVPDFFLDGLRMRIGVQDVAFRTRPHDESFFLDLGEVESFFGGFDAAGRRIANSVDRDVLEAAGMSLLWTPYPVLSVTGFAVVYDENGASVDDELVYGLLASARVAEGVAVWAMALMVSGGEPDLGRIWTFGAGANAYAGDGRWLELFAELYGQGGKLIDNVRKSAFAFNAGARALFGRAWLEAGASLRTGDKDAGDDSDEAFQSFENENRFLGLQSAEFGLDVDTNVLLVRAAAGAGPFDLDGHPLRLRLDVGRFEADEPVVADETDWGVEVDLAADLEWNESLAFQVKFAWLGASDLLERFTPGGDDHGLLFLATADLRF
ncbi:MAG TPA: hypothetical protein VF950_15395 [Planctomycetota bacterium]